MELADPRIISLDIETYGACETNWQGCTLPRQTVFHPRRSLFTDEIPSKDLVLSCAITLPQEDPRSSCWDGRSLGLLRPGDTMFFRMDQPRDRRTLARWIEYADTIIGMNIPFDIQYLRAFDPLYREVLTGRHTLLDVSVLNYLHDETRTEKSLKSLGPIFRTHSYDHEKLIKFKRFPSPHDPSFQGYNCQDTHNTLAILAALARRIVRDFSRTAKLSDYCNRFYSDVLWSVIELDEAGVPLDTKQIEEFEKKLVGRTQRIQKICSSKEVLLVGKGSPLSLRTFFERCADRVRCMDRMELTDKKKEVSTGETNRNLLLSLLPPRSEEAKICRLLSRHAHDQKLISSYTYPILRHRRTKFSDQSSRAIPHPRKRRLSVVYPLWYATPGPQKDDKGAEGGTRQGRITCKGPALLTWPPPIRRALTSFWGVEEGVLVWMDLDQAELRTATLLSGEQSMLRAYREGTDLHRERAALIFDVVVEAVSKLQRQVGKTINFADLFRSGAAKMRATVLEMTGIDLPLEFFEQVARSRKVQRPQLWAWQESLIREVRQHGYLALPFTGQSRYFLGGEKFDENEIVNCPVQTTAGNTLLRIQARLRRTLPSLNGREPWCFVRVNWYDALIVDTKRERLDELKEHVEEAVRWVEREDYWGMLQEMTGNEVALKYDMKYQ